MSFPKEVIYIVGELTNNIIATDGGYNWAYGLTNILGFLHGCFFRSQSMLCRFLTRWAAARSDPTSPSHCKVTDY